MSKGNAEFVMEELNKTARDDYLASLFFPAEHRPAAQALLAFSAELRGVRQRVSEPTPGEIRLQWWHDALSGEGHGNVRSNPIADCLLNAIEKYDLPIVPLKRLIAAHRFDLYNDAMPNTNQFEGYAGETRSCIYQIIAMLCSGENADPSEYADAAGHAGVASTYIARIVNFGRDSANGHIFLPLDVFRTFGVQENDILAGQRSDGLSEAMQAHLAAANAHIGAAKRAIGELGPANRHAFVSIALVEKQLQIVEKNLRDPYNISPGPSDLSKLWTMFWFSVNDR